MTEPRHSGGSSDDDDDWFSRELCSTRMMYPPGSRPPRCAGITSPIGLPTRIVPSQDHYRHDFPVVEVQQRTTNIYKSGLASMAPTSLLKRPTECASTSVGGHKIATVAPTAKPAIHRLEHDVHAQRGSKEAAHRAAIHRLEHDVHAQRGSNDAAHRAAIHRLEHDVHAQRGSNDAAHRAAIHRLEHDVHAQRGSKEAAHVADNWTSHSVHATGKDERDTWGTSLRPKYSYQKDALDVKMIASMKQKDYNKTANPTPHDDLRTPHVKETTIRAKQQTGTKQQGFTYANNAKMRIQCQLRAAFNMRDAILPPIGETHKDAFLDTNLRQFVKEPMAHPRYDIMENSWISQARLNGVPWDAMYALSTDGFQNNESRVRKAHSSFDDDDDMHETRNIFAKNDPDLVKSTKYTIAHAYKDLNIQQHKTTDRRNYLTSEDVHMKRDVKERSTRGYVMDNKGKDKTTHSFKRDIVNGNQEGSRDPSPNTFSSHNETDSPMSSASRYSYDSYDNVSYEWIHQRSANGLYISMRPSDVPRLDLSFLYREDDGKRKKYKKVESENKLETCMGNKDKNDMKVKSENKLKKSPDKKREKDMQIESGHDADQSEKNNGQKEAEYNIEHFPEKTYEKEKKVEPKSTLQMATRNICVAPVHRPAEIDISKVHKVQKYYKHAEVVIPTDANTKATHSQADKRICSKKNIKKKCETEMNLQKRPRCTTKKTEIPTCYVIASGSPHTPAANTASTGEDASQKDERQPHKSKGLKKRIKESKLGQLLFRSSTAKTDIGDTPTQSKNMSKNDNNKDHGQADAQKRTGILRFVRCCWPGTQRPSEECNQATAQY